MQDIESFPAGRLRRGKRRWLRFGKPACKIQRKGYWGRAHFEEICTQGLVVANWVLKKIYNFYVPTWPSRLPTSALATTWVMTEPSPDDNPNIVLHVLESFAIVQNSMKNSGPLSGAASATNFPTSRMAWQRTHLLLLPVKIGLEDRDLIWLTALASRVAEEATGGRGWGSTVLSSGIWSGSVSDNGKTLCYYWMQSLEQVHQNWEGDATVTGSEITGCTCADVAVGELKYFS